MKFCEAIINPRSVLFTLGLKGYFRFFTDETYLKFMYWCKFHQKLNLENPVRYTEKLQWLKVYNRKPEYTSMVDKCDVKQYVADIIGEEYIIPTLGVYDRFDDIDFDKLPNCFVLKCTHDSGGLIIVKDKSKFDKKEAKAKIEKCLKNSYYLAGREWVYKDLSPRIIAETYMEDEKVNELRDYKFFSFDGKVKMMFVASQRQDDKEETKFDFYDREFRHLDIKNGHPNSTIEIEKPQNFEQMILLAEKLSEGIPHLRVDFYEVNGKIYFGELTFFHWSGFIPFEPDEWDYTIGEWLTLPSRSS